MSTKAEASVTSENTQLAHERPGDPAEHEERQPRRLWRWTKRLTLLFLLITTVTRFALPPLLPKLLEGPLSAHGLALDWERLELSLFGGHLKVQHLDLWSGERSAGPPVDGSGLVHVEFLVADVDMSALLFGRLRIQRLEIDGVDLRIERNKQGQIDWMHAFAGEGSSNATKGKNTGENEFAGLLDALPENLDFPIEVSAARLQHLRLTFIDQATELQVLTTEMQLRLSDLGHDRRDGRFSFNASSSGLLDRFHVEGPLRFSSHPGGTPKAPPMIGLDVALNLELLGLRPKAIAPLLAELGIQARDEDLDASGDLRLAIGPGRRVAVDIQGLKLSSGGRLSAGLESFAFAAEQLEKGGVLEVQTANVRGGNLVATREADGVLAIAGLAFVGAPETDRKGNAEPESQSKGAPATKPAKLASLPRVLLPELRLHDLTASFEDRAVEPAAQLLVHLEEFSLRQLHLGAAEPPPVRLEFLAHLPGVLADLRASGELEPFIEQPHARVDFSGTGLGLDALTPYLVAAGIESQWDNGEVRGQLDVRTAKRDQQLEWAVEVSGLHLGSETLGEVAGLDLLGIKGLRATEKGVDLERLELRGANLGLELDPHGPWRALGLSSAAPTVMDDPMANQRPLQYESLGLSEGELTLSALRLREDEISAQLTGTLGLGNWVKSLTIQSELSGRPEDFEANLALSLQGWRGATVARFLHAEPPPEDSVGSAQIRGRVQFDQNDHLSRARASFDTLDLALPPLIDGSVPHLSADELRVDLELAEADGVQTIRVNKSVAGLKASQWLGYLPAGIDLDLSNAQLDSAISAEIGTQTLPAIEATDAAPAQPAEEASTLHLTVERTGLFDAEGAMLLGLEELEVSAPLMANRELKLDRIAMRGGRLRAHRDAEGALHLPGLRVSPVTPEIETAPGSDAPVADADGVAGSGRGGLPARVSLGALELELAEFRFDDALQPEAPPLLLNMALRSAEPCLIYDEDAEEQAALPLAITFGAAPALTHGQLDLDVSPFDDQPRLQAALLLEGLSAEGALSLAPDLADRLSATELTDGVFQAKLDVALDLRRRGPLDFDLSQGYGVELEVRDVELRGAPEAEPLLGLEALRLEAPELQPSTGDFRIQAIEVQRPQARVARRPEGLEIAGVMLKTSAPSGDEPHWTKTEDESSTEKIGSEVQQAEPAGKPGAATRVRDREAVEAEAMRLSVGELFASGLDLRIEDTTGDVPMVVPLDELDFELRGLDTGAPSKPVRFNLLVGSGEVPLPERAPEKNLVSGLAGFAVDMLDGSKTKERALEPRPVFEELVVSGQVQLGGPEGDGLPTGWTQIDVTAFELLAARGPAGAAGLTITDGVMDFTAKARLNGSEGLRLDTKTTLGHLALSEPADGPVSKWLKLPAPLDSVVFLLKDGAGEVRLPFNVVMSEEGLSVGQLLGELALAFTKVTAAAVASSPLRVAGGVTDFLGLGGDTEEAPQLEEFQIQFPIGLDLLTPDQLGRIALIAQRFRSNENLVGVVTHVLGQGDLARAEALANPSPTAREDLHHRLNARREELERQRAELAAEIRSQWLVGLVTEAEAARQRLKLIEVELLASENALDRVLELLSPRAERNRERRTRQIALAMAELRLAEFQRRLEHNVLPSDIDERLRIQMPRFRVDESLQAGGALQFTLKNGASR